MKDNDIEAAFIATCVGSLEDVVLRDSRLKDLPLKGSYEIVSVEGTVSYGGDAHIHITIAEESCNVLGGHLKSGKVYTTAEVVLKELEGYEFSRENDEKTKFDELVVRSNS